MENLSFLALINNAVGLTFLIGVGGGFYWAYQKYIKIKFEIGERVKVTLPDGRVRYGAVVHQFDDRVRVNCADNIIDVKLSAVARLKK